MLICSHASCSCPFSIMSLSQDQIEDVTRQLCRVFQVPFGTQVRDFKILRDRVYTHYSKVPSTLKALKPIPVIEEIEAIIRQNGGVPYIPPLQIGESTKKVAQSSGGLFSCCSSTSEGTANNVTYSDRDEKIRRNDDLWNRLQTTLKDSSPLERRMVTCGKCIILNPDPRDPLQTLCKCTFSAGNTSVIVHPSLIIKDADPSRGSISTSGALGSAGDEVSAAKNFMFSTIATDAVGVHSQGDVHIFNNGSNAPLSSDKIFRSEDEAKVLSQARNETIFASPGRPPRLTKLDGTVPGSPIKALAASGKQHSQNGTRIFVSPSRGIVLDVTDSTQKLVNTLEIIETLGIVPRAPSALRKRLVEEVTKANEKKIVDAANENRSDGGDSHVVEELGIVEDDRYPLKTAALGPGAPIKAI